MKATSFCALPQAGIGRMGPEFIFVLFKNNFPETLEFQTVGFNILLMQRGANNPVPLVLYGVPFHNVTFEEAVEWAVERVRSGRPASMATANLDFLTRAWQDPELQRLLIDADLVLADGFPIVKYSHKFGPKLKERVTGSDMAPLLAARAAVEGMSVFGLGGKEGVAEKALKRLKERHPDLKIAGFCSPKFAPVLEMDHERILKQLKKTKPDILFVSLGAPKQDKFIQMHVRNWEVPVAIGVGAALDFIAGEQVRAPRWMQRINLEWFWRMSIHPFRLFPRYFLNARFILKATRHLRRIQRGPNKEATCQLLSIKEEERLDALNISLRQYHPIPNEDEARAWVDDLEKLCATGSILLDIAATPWLNSLELGALLQGNRICRSRGYRLILYGPRPKVMDMLTSCRLTDYFNVAFCLDDVEYLAKHLAQEPGIETFHEEQMLTVDLPVEITAATLKAFQSQLNQVQEELGKRKKIKRVVVNAGHLDFIDSSGLGLLISLKKVTHEKQISLVFKQLSPLVKQIFEVANVDDLLLKH
jgi:N-acetylglucosaminyldiphosphoundecaprenol N-acetyl-beta-D-mannosaminyltransferase